MSGPSTPWTLEYLELATHHGNTSGALTLFVLPWDSTGYVRPAAVWTLVLWMALAAILALPSPRLASRYARVLHRTIAGALILLLAISQCSQWIRPTASCSRPERSCRAWPFCLFPGYGWEGGGCCGGRREPRVDGGHWLAPARAGALVLGVLPRGRRRPPARLLLGQLQRLPADFATVRSTPTRCSNDPNRS